MWILEGDRVGGLVEAINAFEAALPCARGRRLSAADHQALFMQFAKVIGVNGTETVDAGVEDIARPEAC